MEVLALEAAKRYSPPDEDVWQRDWNNQHAIFTIDKGRVNFRDKLNKDYAEEFGNSRRKILKKFVDEIGVGTFKLPFDASMHDFVGVQMNVDYEHSILGASILDDDRINICIPDFYAMENYGGKLDDVDLLPTDHKVDRLLFLGAATGDPDPSKNKRISFCKFSKNRDWIDAYITDVNQIGIQNIFNFDSKLVNYFHSPIPPRFQKMYKHIASIDGNTAAWDRIPWIMASNSVLWKYESPHKCWYYPLMKPWQHYVPFTLETIDDIWGGSRQFPILIQNSNNFAKHNLTRAGHQEYMKLFFENIKELKEP
jgi:hypothetical protein